MYVFPNSLIRTFYIAENSVHKIMTQNVILYSKFQNHRRKSLDSQRKDKQEKKNRSNYFFCGAKYKLSEIMKSMSKNVYRAKDTGLF